MDFDKIWGKLESIDSRLGRVEQKVYNGYSENLERISQTQSEMATTVKEISQIVHENSKRIQGCEDADSSNERIQDALEQQSTKRIRKIEVTVGVVVGIVGMIFGLTTIILNLIGVL